MSEYVFFKCIRCGKSLGRFTPKGIFQTLDTRGMVYKCPNCHRRYATTAIAFYIHLIICSILFFLGIFFVKIYPGVDFLAYILLIIFLFLYATFMPLKPVSLKGNK